VQPSTAEALTQYVRALYAPEDDLLRAVRAEIAARGMPPIHIRPEEGQMLRFLLAAVGARRVIEIGTLAGYSGLWMARALPEDGLLITLEREPERAAVARAFFEQAGLSARVEVRLGSARDILSGLAAQGPFDAVFIDADKDRYPEYLDWSVENIRPGGLIMAHNAFLRGAVVGLSERAPRHIEAIQAFNRRLADDPRLLGTIIPVGDGIAAAIRL
jgi:caffeoyl-CoA O-methyltransferase